MASMRIFLIQILCCWLNPVKIVWAPYHAITSIDAARPGLRQHGSC